MKCTKIPRKEEFIYLDLKKQDKKTRVMQGQEVKVSKRECAMWMGARRQCVVITREHAIGWGTAHACRQGGEEGDGGEGWSPGAEREGEKRGAGNKQSCRPFSAASLRHWSYCRYRCSSWQYQLQFDFTVLCRDPFGTLAVRNLRSAAAVCVRVNKAGWDTCTKSSEAGTAEKAADLHSLLLIFLQREQHAYLTAILHQQVGVFEGM